jgi:hypothetical protein
MHPGRRRSNQERDDFPHDGMAMSGYFQQAARWGRSSLEDGCCLLPGTYTERVLESTTTLSIQTEPSLVNNLILLGHSK